MHTHGRRGIRDARILLELIGREEDLDELAGHVGHGELAEQLRLAPQSFRHAVPQAVFDGVEGGGRGRIIPAGALEHLLAGHTKDEPASERIPIQQEAHEATLAPAPGSPPAGHAARRRERDLAEDRGRHQLVDHPQAEGFRGALGLPGENHVERRPRTHQSRQPLAAAGRR